jgi:hypothetical protein
MPPYLCVEQLFSSCGDIENRVIMDRLEIYNFVDA